MTRRLSFFLLTALMLVAGAPLVMAQSQPGGPAPFTAGAQSPGAGQDRAITANRPSPVVGEPSMRQRAWNWLLTQQARINRQLADAVKALKSAGSFTSAMVLAGLSFAYGVLHAAGPGHGKAVISSYVLANERTVRRGIMLSFLAAFIQALSAIAIVGVLAILLNATSLEIKSAENWIETLSWGLVAAIGAWLLYGQIAKLFNRPTAGTGTHDCGHDHAGHEHGAGCNHAHMPSPKDLSGDLHWSKALAIALSVGIRPCTGAITVMIFAMSQGLLWAGIFATFAMALGTAITVSALAALAVGSREWAAKLGDGDGRWATRVATAAGLAGSAFVFLLGTAFFVASLQATGQSPL